MKRIASICKTKPAPTPEPKKPAKKGKR
jgi:hypothetical protein